MITLFPVASHGLTPAENEVAMAFDPCYTLLIGHN